MAAGIKESFHAMNLQECGVKVSVSKEDMNFLCSEEGFKKMKQDAADLYVKNIEQQKVIAKGRDQEDPFWSNTGNQWLVFSKMLYDNGFYTGMDVEEVKRFEDTLACATFGMDCLSRSQYLTGIEFRPAQEEFKYFMSSCEASTELESSVSALKYLSARFLPKEQQEGFEQLIDMYRKHNNEVLAEYNNPMESFNKVVAGMHSEKSFYSLLHEETADKPVGEYKFTIMLGGMKRSEQERKQYLQDLQELFEKMKDGGSNSSVWEKIKERFQKYATGDSDDAAFKSYVYGQAQYLFDHMKNCWGRLLELSAETAN
ncbi:MAG: hypothetical protein K2K63_14570 [Acetatifactor sp.]|nr:hypothetical protein [Acetatifactor sp.]